MICGEKIRKNEKRLKKKKQAVVPDVTDSYLYWSRWRSVLDHTFHLNPNIGKTPPILFLWDTHWRRAQLFSFFFFLRL